MRPESADLAVLLAEIRCPVSRRLRRLRHRERGIASPLDGNWQTFRRARSELQKKWELVGEVRGLGGMCAIELVRDTRTKDPPTQRRRNCPGIATNMG